MYVPPKLHSRKPELSSAILRPSGATGEPTSDKERVPSGSLSARSSSLACGSSSRTHHPVVASPRLSRTAQITTQSECIGRLSCVQPAERLARCAFLHACAKSSPHTHGVCSMLTRSTENDPTKKGGWGTTPFFVASDRGARGNRGRDMSGRVCENNATVSGFSIGV